VTRKHEKIVQVPAHPLWVAFTSTTDKHIHYFAPVHLLLVEWYTDVELDSIYPDTRVTPLIASFDGYGTLDNPDNASGLYALDCHGLVTKLPEDCFVTDMWDGWLQSPTGIT
jgi:hypothetical protein